MVSCWICLYMSIKALSHFRAGFLHVFSALELCYLHIWWHYVCSCYCTLWLCLLEKWNIGGSFFYLKFVLPIIDAQHIVTSLYLLWLWHIKGGCCSAIWGKSSGRRLQNIWGGGVDAHKTCVHTHVEVRKEKLLALVLSYLRMHGEENECADVFSSLQYFYIYLFGLFLCACSCVPMCSCIPVGWPEVFSCLYARHAWPRTISCFCTHLSWDYDFIFSNNWLFFFFFLVATVEMIISVYPSHKPTSCEQNLVLPHLPYKHACRWNMCVRVALQWTGIHSRVYSCFQYSAIFPSPCWVLSASWRRFTLWSKSWLISRNLIHWQCYLPDLNISL